MPIPQKHFYMMRHGQTEANAAEIMAGSLDSPLTELGRMQAQQAREVIMELPIKPVAIFHSHLSRAKDTAYIINKELDVPIFEDKDLAEIHAGEWEGVTYDACIHFLDDWAQAPGGEASEDFFNRIKCGKVKAISQFNEPVLIVCHGGVMRGFGEIYGIRTPGKFENAHLYEFHPKPDNGKFPWDVYDYRLCQKTRTLIKTKSTIYSSDC